MNYNKIDGLTFGLWGLLHVAVGAIALVVYFTGGTAPMLEFVDVDAAVNQQAPRMADLVVQFYQALLLIGLTVTVLGTTLNWRGRAVKLVDERRACRWH